MQNRHYRGLVVVAPPHLNPENKPNKYVFSGTMVPDSCAFACSFHVIALPGYTTPGQFAEDVAAQRPLPGDLELLAPRYDLGTCSYFRLSTGKFESAKAEAINGTPSETFQGSHQQTQFPHQQHQTNEPEPTNDTAEWNTQSAEPPIPGLDF